MTNGLPTLDHKRQSAVIEQFNRDSDRYLSKNVRAETRRERMRLFALVSREVPYARTLDVGCGPATLSEDLLGISEEVWGVDSSERMIELATQRMDSMPARSRIH